MGATFIDYFIVDRFVSPVERSGELYGTLKQWMTSLSSSTEKEFSEHMIYLPHCYQVNHYPPRHIKYTNGTTRNDWGLPRDHVVLANFNKNDKIEPVAFSVWMSIMRKVPNSILWLLRPKSDVAFQLLHNNLRKEAAARGISPSRLVFAPRWVAIYECLTSD